MTTIEELRNDKEILQKEIRDAIDFFHKKNEGVFIKNITISIEPANIKKLQYSSNVDVEILI